jgi:hypothetical protein
MKFPQNNHPTRLFGPTRLIGTWEYLLKGFFLNLSMNYGSLKSAKIVLSKSIFNDKNQPNFFKKKIF